MSYDAKTERLIALKKLAGKAQTSNDKGLANEGLPSGITMASESVFGEPVSTDPSNSQLYDRTGKVEYVRFQSTFIAGTDTSDGRHGFELKLPVDYESATSNPLAGTYPFLNNQSVNITSGSLQLVPPSFSTTYEAKPYYGGTTSKDSGTQIPILDARDWYLDYFNGVFFQQDPPGTGGHAENPDYVEGFLYIGEMLDVVVKNSGSAGGGGSEFFTSPVSGFLNTTGSTAFAGGLGTSYKTSDVGSDVVFFVSGSRHSTGQAGSNGVAVFGGDVIISGTIAGPSPLEISSAGIEFSGSAGDTVAVSNPSGSVKVFARDEVKIGSATGSIRLIDLGDSTAGKIFLTGSVIDSQRRVKLQSRGQIHFTNTPKPLESGADIFLFASGAAGKRGSHGVSLFGGDVVTSGSIYSELGLSGSHTRLCDGSSFIVAGSGISISSSSNGQITLSSILATRTKVNRKLTGSIAADQDCNLSINFSSVSYDINRIDIFVNGQLMQSGTNDDYYLNVSKTGSIRFNFPLMFDDNIIATMT